MRTYWRRLRRMDSKDTVYVIKYDKKTDTAKWHSIHKDHCFYNTETPELKYGFKQRASRYSSIYHPITKKQYLMSIIKGSFYEDKSKTEV